MDANQIEKMKALALAAGDWAPPEPWEDDRNYSDREIRGLEFCAAANPAAVLELIAEVERLRAAPAAGTVEKDAILEQAAAIADAERAEFMEQSCKNNGRESDFAFGSVNSAERIAASIRAIKSDAITAHTKAGKANA